MFVMKESVLTFEEKTTQLFTTNLLNIIFDDFSIHV